MTVKTVDPKTFELACHFLDDMEGAGSRVPDGDRMALAIEIQSLIEDWLEAYGIRGRLR